MARVVIALYDRFTDANEAVRDLVDEGFPREDISLVASDFKGEYRPYLTDEGRSVMEPEESATASGAGVGAGIGAVLGGLGGLLVGLGALAIPGIGPIVAAGPLAAALSALAGAGVGAVAGGVTGGLIGALVDLGIPEEEAHYYSEGVRRGGSLVTVHTEDHRANEARNILNRHNPVDMSERVTSWRGEGWTGFDPDADPYTVDEYERERARYGTATSADLTDEYERERAMYGTTTGTDIADDYGTYYDTFYQHYQVSLVDTGYPYDYYEPAYRFGYERANEGLYSDREWEEVEPEFRERWERDNPGTWERVKASIRHAWEEVKDAVS